MALTGEIDEVGAEGLLDILLGQVAVLDTVLGHQLARIGRLAQHEGPVAGAHGAVDELGVGLDDPKSCGLRLQAARTLMLIDGFDAASAAFEVGYESASQFNREYSRFFGRSPLRDVKALRAPRPGSGYRSRP